LSYQLLAGLVMQDFRNLHVWQRAHQLTLMIYRLTTEFPRDELFGLRTQLRKTAVEIAAFIAEGCGKPNDSEFSRSISIALANANRLEYYALVARDLNLLNDPDSENVATEVTEVKKMLHGLNHQLR
jgi:four helix bundle protein